jgi:hypothetical protein
MASVDEHGQSHASRATVIKQGVECRTDASTSEEHVVDEYHGLAVDGNGYLTGSNWRRRGAARHVVPVKPDVEAANRNRHALELLDCRCKPARDWVPAGEQTDENEAIGAPIVFDDFVPKAAHGARNLVRAKVRSGGASHEKRLPRNSGQAHRLTRVPAMPDLLPSQPHGTTLKGFAYGIAGAASGQ